MLVYEYRCDGCKITRDFYVTNTSAAAPACPTCGGQQRRAYSSVNLGNSASAGVSREQMPRSWNAISGGDKQLVDKWRAEAIKRDALEERHPELAGDRRPVLAHEGIFADKPLRAGDPLPAGLTAPSPASGSAPPTP